MSSSRRHGVAPRTETPRRPHADELDLGGDAIDRVTRLGAVAVGGPLVFTPSGAILDHDRRFAALTREAAPVVASDGETFGTLRAARFGEGPLDLSARRALTDAAALIAGDLSAKTLIGQTDHVTGLPNRVRFERDFSNVAKAARPGDRLMLVTIAEARQYNEILRALGHACSETFVRRGLEMIRDVIGHEIRVYHVSVLSFAFVFSGYDAEALAREIVAAFAAPVVCDGLPVMTRVGVGLTPIGADQPRPAETLRSALAAAQDSRNTSEGFAYYDRRADEAHLRVFTLLVDLESAIRRNEELSLVYQPRIDLCSGETVSAEALIRWRHPTLGFVSPAEFVTLAETTTIIGELTRWVLRHACRQSAAWRRAGLDMKLSINVSPSNLRQAGFAQQIADLAATGDVPPERLEFEFTEGMLTTTDIGVRATIDEIRATGATVAIDDFGTGYSNFEYLTRLSVDVLKLDRGFIQPLEDDVRRQTLVRSMIDLSHALDFRIVAEGIETQKVYDLLKSWGCDEGQGYYMSRPLAPADFAAFAGGG